MESHLLLASFRSIPTWPGNEANLLSVHHLQTLKL